jgi:hypothetical protein
MDHIVLPFGDRHTLLCFDKGELTPLSTFPLFPLSSRVEISGGFLVTFAACKSALIVQDWLQTGRVGLPEIIELPKGVIGESILVTNEDELFVGGKSNRPWLGRMRLQDPIRSWVSVLSDKDLENAYEKGIDALSLSFGGEFGPRIIAYDNLMLPLYAWIIDATQHGWSNPKRVEIEPEYTYEHIISAYATDDYVYLITRGINHGKTMQFLRRFDKNMHESTLLWAETKNDCWSKEFEDGKMYESGEEWLQVTATEDGVVLIAAGSAGLGIYNPTNCEINYLGRAGQSARFISLIELDSSVAVAFESKDRPLPYQWEIEVFSTDGSAKFSYMQLNSQEFRIVK